MKLRRTLAAAAASAALVPATLLGAGIAHADASPTASESSTTSPTPERTPGDSTGSPTGTDPASDVTSTPSGTPSDDTTATSSASPSVTATPTDTGSPSPSATVSSPPSPSMSTKPGDGPITCNDQDEPASDENLSTTLSGLPSKVVAGSGWHGFKLNVATKGDASYKRVDLGVFASAISKATFEHSGGHLTLQWQDPDSGEWIDISLDDTDEGAGYVGWTNVDPKESFSLDLRLSVDKSAPAGLGIAISIGMYANDEGDCVVSGNGDSFYQFDILAAGTDAGDVDDSKPQTGGTTPVTRPSGDTPIGSLAETGASSSLPLIATVGGVAMVVGAGAIFTVRRRKSGVAA
ncbi:LAETG motif-containing sortase-dependent surface protein [Actinacidiphila sp. bgisy167]|uniref:LAETG motif-containing sortase-dependent surface protein n=1 Tax=Actinacidiphila sp. bgisy167 TaxID=3413797 RepID=UPI003D75749C